MARTHARVLLSAWQDDDFTGLSLDEQWAFLMLISAPDLSRCGVLTYIPKRWAKLNADLDVERVTAAVDGLEPRGMVVIDRETDELWVCSFVKHDGILSQPNMVKAMRSAAANVLSKRLRDGLAERYLNDLPEPPAPNPSRKGLPKGSVNPSPKGYRKGSPKPFTEGLPEGLPEGQGVGVGVGVGVHLKLLTQLSEGAQKNAAHPGDRAQRIKNAIAIYVREYRSVHGAAPLRADINTLARQLKPIADECSDAELAAVCICIGKLAKDPRHVRAVLSDYRREVKAGTA